MARLILVRRAEILTTFAVVIFLSYTASYAQSNLDDVHITPRATAPATGGVHEAAIRVNASMVLVPVTITDGMNRVVTGLEQANFEVLENKQRQEIKHFSNQDEPVSLGIIFDTSTSMNDKIDWA